ncbi:MAG TPA: DUF3135 domain-containing protein [Gammaproteobacteria bacterium]|nr:DUF3135 domain-containing protein [Gammaproteobacteria bacterium]
MRDSNAPDFDFDGWARLARTDPEAFEQQREKVLRAVINEAPPHMRRRLAGVQWRVDMERRRSNSPLAACVRTFTMMWDSVYAEGGLVDALQALRNRQPPRCKRPAQLIEFPRARPPKPDRLLAD